MSLNNHLSRELEETDLRTRSLIDDLGESQLAVPYSPGINPPIWEVGHAAFFYEYFLLRGSSDNTPLMPGYDEIWDSFEIPHKHRWTTGIVPDKVRTLDYYTRVLEEVRTRLSGPELDPDEHFLVRYAIGHQQMHIESLIWARQTLGYPKPCFSNGDPSSLQTDPGAVGNAHVEGGTYRIGMPAGTADRHTDGFSFDNERPGFSAEVSPFQISKTLVSNGDFLEFVEDDGYARDSLWSFGGKWWLNRLSEDEPKAPAYWRQTESGAWQQRHFDTWMDLKLDAPALHVSFWEAEAYCEWAGRRLPTEQEWEAAARGPDARLVPWGGSSMDASRVDMDATYLGLASVSAFPAGASPAGCLQMLGTAWEWTSCQFLPYDGFKTDMYRYMSVLQFGDHKVTKGGSCATSSGLIRNTYRQAYFPDRRDVFTGFRTCARRPGQAS